MPKRQLTLTTTLGTGEEAAKGCRHPFVLDHESLAREVDALPRASIACGQRKGHDGFLALIPVQLFTR